LEVAGHDRFGLWHGRSETPIFTEGHRAETERAHAKAGTAECDVVIQWHGELLIANRRYATAAMATEAIASAAASAPPSAATTAAVSRARAAYDASPSSRCSAVAARAAVYRL